MIKKVMLAAVISTGIAASVAAGVSSAAATSTNDAGCTPGTWHNDYQCCHTQWGNDWYQGGCKYAPSSAHEALLNDTGAAR